MSVPGFKILTPHGDSIRCVSLKPDRYYMTTTDSISQNTTCVTLTQEMVQKLIDDLTNLLER